MYVIRQFIRILNLFDWFHSVCWYHLSSYGEVQINWSSYFFETEFLMFSRYASGIFIRAPAYCGPVLATPLLLHSRSIPMSQCWRSLVRMTWPSGTGLTCPVWWPGAFLPTTPRFAGSGSVHRCDVLTVVWMWYFLKLTLLITKWFIWIFHNPMFVSRYDRVNSELHLQR